MAWPPDEVVQALGLRPGERVVEHRVAEAAVVERLRARGGKASGRQVGRYSSLVVASG